MLLNDYVQNFIYTKLCLVGKQSGEKQTSFQKQIAKSLTVLFTVKTTIKTH